MNISKILALHELITNDAYAITFQSLPQYRTALRNLLIANQPAPTVPVGGMPQQQSEIWRKDNEMVAGPKPKGEGWIAFTLPQHNPYPTQAALYADLNFFEIDGKAVAAKENVTLHRDTVFKLTHLARVALAHQPAQEQAEPTWGAVETVGDMVRNLLTLDQAAPVFTAFHVTIDGQRRCRVTQGITISRERVVDGKWIDSARKDVPYANIVWARPDERAQQEPVAAPTHCDPAEGFCAKCRADERAVQQAALGALPERDPSKPAEQQGLFRKFDVRRTDGSDQLGEKHHGCRYYVLDLTHDQHAPAAMRAYGAACTSTHPQLAADIRAEFGAPGTPEAPKGGA